MSVPVAYYTTLFRPQLWGFFLFDFERGFSFYWCCKVFGLLFAVGWCLRQMGLRSAGLIIFGAVWVSFSSYIQWWFSSPAMLPEMIASWAVCLGCALHLLRRSSPWRVAAMLGCFIFFAINFLLCLYPPYQIPLLWLAVAILGGFWWQGRGETNVALGWALARLALALVLLSLILIPFCHDVQTTLELVNQTVYPGARRTTGGALSLLKVFSGVVGFFECEQTGPRLYPNIAEASNFYPLWPAAGLALAVAALCGRIQIHPALIAIGGILVCLTLYCVVPWPRWLANATLLSFSTERRVLLALGLANIFFCCLFLDRYREPILTKVGAWGSALACWLALIALLWVLNLHDPAFLSDPLQLALAVCVNTAVLALFFHENLRKALPPLLGVLLVFSNAGINPVVAGLGPLLHSEAVRTLERLRASDPEAKWIAFQSRYFAQLVKAVGANVFNGTKVLPDLPLLHQLDQGTTNEFTYNRYANIECELPRPGRATVVSGGLVHPDLYVLFLSPDLPALQNAGYRYLLFPRPWNGAPAHGFSLIEKTRGDLWIYRAQPAAEISAGAGRFEKQLAHF